MKKILAGLLVLISSISYANTVKIIVPFTAGGAFDVTARQFSKFAERESARNFLVTNVVGAGSLIGTKELLTSPPNTLMITSSSFYANIVEGNFKLDEFVPVGIIANSPLYLVTNKTQSLTCEKLRSGSKEYFFGHSGKDSISSIPVRLLLQKHKHVVEIPYKGISQASMDLLSNQISAMFVAASSIRPEFDVLAVTSQRPLEGVPTLRDCMGIEKTVQTQWVVVASPGSDENFVSQTNQLLARFVANDETKKIFKTNSMFPQIDNPAATKNMMRSELESWYKLLK